MSRNSRNKGLITALAAGALLAGCATALPPQERMANAQAAVRAAEEMGAPSVPSAALHLQLAREQMEEAKRLIKRGFNERADYVLMRAESDAELSLSLAREAPLRGEAQEAMDKLQILKQENAQ